MKTKLKMTGLGLALISLTACSMNGTANPNDTAEFRHSRYEQVLKIQEFEACRVEALELDSQARTRSSSGAYLTSARVMDKCSADLGTAAEAISQEERMRLSALATLNYFRGGDIEQARRGFESFKTSYPGHDLYFAGGTSFLATGDALLGRSKPQSYGEFATLNVSQTVKSEIRRINHWKNK